MRFDTAALLRSVQKDRIDALVRGVQGGVFSPNETRNQEGYDPPAPGPAAPPSAPAARSYRRVVRRDVEALTLSANGKVARDGAEKAVIRKAKTNDCRMPLILRHKTDRIAFQFGARAALRSANELIDQLQEQPRRERS